MVDIRIDGVSASDSSMTVGSLFYERVASTMVNPVPANTEGYSLFKYNKPEGGALKIISVGTSQHDNAAYHWYIDGALVGQISGPAAIGTIIRPYVFPQPVRVDASIELKVDNLNLKPYPNDSATSIVDRIPFECVVNGIWG